MQTLTFRRLSAGSANRWRLHQHAAPGLVLTACAGAGARAQTPASSSPVGGSASTPAAPSSGSTTSPSTPPALATSPAASEGGAVGEVVITARRREERLKDVPIAASVISGNVLAQRGAIDHTGSLLDGVPGVRFNNTGSPTTSELSIRGSGAARGTTADSGVGLYRNDVYVAGGLQFTRNFTCMDLFDADRVEILRGTLGALYGTNAVGGAVNTVSAQTSFKPGGYADLDYGYTLNSIQFQAVENMPLNDK